MAHKFAIIDVGTNTVNLLIVNKMNAAYEVLFKDKVGVGLGKNGINQKKISPSAFSRGIDCLKSYSKICRDHGTNEIIAIGTSALRNAKNGHQFVKEVKKQTNIEINVINGEQEAELIYNGINLIHPFEKKSLIMDIGGGSTELILADQNGIVEKNSFEIGLSRIHQLFSLSDPFSPDDIQRINRYIAEHVDVSYASPILIGASGSFKTFYKMLNQNSHPDNQCVKGDIKAFDKLLTKIVKSTFESRKNNPLIDPVRYEMLPIAAVKVKWIIERMKIKEIYTSPHSMKEGLIFSV
ncbi:MAG: Ppx/GppA phosphatase family protein [Putridiphycobacter sp.]